MRLYFPDHEAGYEIAASLLCSRNRLDEAEAILREAMARFSTRPWLEKRVSEMARTKRERAKAAQVVGALQTGAAALLADAERRLANRGKVFVVVGMHRAGTTLCARIMNGLGVDLGGPLLGPQADNPEGFLEHLSIQEAHDALFETLDASWDTIWLGRSPTDRIPGPAQLVAARERLTRVVSDQLDAAGGVWGFKDPRTARFLPLWQDIFGDLGVQPVWILAVRDPRAVAASLLARNGLPPAMGELLWVEYYLDALRHLGARIAGVIHYEKWFSSPLAQVQNLAAMIGNGSNEAEAAVARSIKADLRHDFPGSGGYSLEVAQVVHSWLSSDVADLGLLQRRADALWRSMEAMTSSTTR